MSCSQGPLRREVDIEDLSKKFDSFVNRTFPEPNNEDAIKHAPIIFEILERKDDYLKQDVIQHLLRKHCTVVKNSFLFQVYVLLKAQHDFSVEDEAYIRQVLKIKAGKSHSGIVSITVFTSGMPEWTDPITGEQKKQIFSCKWDCHYCPNTGDMNPRSYLPLEPGVLRANRNNFICVSQMHDRLKALYLCGHDCDKLEILVLGGTLCSYPTEYREEFVRDIYYSANTFFDTLKQGSLRDKLSLTDEKIINRTTRCKVIGLTLETRPDTITAKELKLFRYYGCTRVQLGVQHIDNDVLKAVNRQCKTETTMKAIKLLKDSNFKIDAHWMPNLVGSSVEKDTNMFNELLDMKSPIVVETTNDERYEVYDMRNTSLQVDQWKVYPTTIVPYTEIEKMFREGTYVPYPQEQMKDMLVQMKIKMLPWIRLNRIIRDICYDYSYVADYRPNLRQDLQCELKKLGKKCACLRCTEVKQKDFNKDDVILITREFISSGGTEYFISFQSKDISTMYGFLRLRLTKDQPIHIFPELEGCALVRELHVYGNMHVVGKESTHVQHQGFGKRLLSRAEDIAKKQGYTKISVISGEGVRGYYSKRGYIDNEGVGKFMIKSLE